MEFVSLQSVLAALSTVSFASDETSLIPANPMETSSEDGVPALFSWADFDGDGRLDLAAVSPQGQLQILANAGDGRFEDVTEQVGVSGITNAALALWADYDSDSRLDLFVGARAGKSQLFHNEGGAFIDLSAGSGLEIEGAVQSAHWLDHDGDGRLDLHVVTAGKNELFRGLEGGFFDATELPRLGSVTSDAVPRDTVDAVQHDAPSGSRPSSGMNNISGGAMIDAPPIADDVLPTRRRVPLGRGPSVIAPGPGSTGMQPIMGSTSCLETIHDQANPGSCLEASTTPALGRLYPLSTNLFVAIGGNVGIGTTTPAAKLDVAGTARMSDTLTLNPSGDQALHVSTGSIYKGGALFIHTKGGCGNSAFGRRGLENVTTGFNNTASGHRALYSNSSGFNNTANGAFALRTNNGSANTASGAFALSSNTTGGGNTALGNSALSSNTIGSSNTACGVGALGYNTTGSNNTAIGIGALGYNTTGQRNIALGRNAGQYLTTGDNNIDIGNVGFADEGATIRIGTTPTHTRAFIAGIRGTTTAFANAIPVLVDSAGQLGTVSSSRRFKKEIADMGDLTERLLELRPVVFRYKQEQRVESGEVPLEYGLIAEEVAEIFPDLAVYDEEGQPFTVKYHLLSSMLLNELKKLATREEHQSRELEILRSRVEALEEQVAPTATYAATR